LLTQPLADAFAGIHRRLLQRLQRGDAAIQTLQITLRLLLRLGRLLQRFTQLLQAFIERIAGRGERFEIELTGGKLLAQLENRHIFRIGSQQRTFVIQPTLTFGQSFQTLLQLLDARLLDLSHAAWLSAELIEAFPLFLPALHGRLRLFQLDGRFLRGGARELLLGLEHRQFLAERGQQRAVVTEV